MTRQLITATTHDPGTALARMTTYFARHHVRVVSLATNETVSGTVMTQIAASHASHTPELMQAQLSRIVEVHTVSVRAADGV